MLKVERAELEQWMVENVLAQLWTQKQLSLHEVQQKMVQSMLVAVRLLMNVAGL